MRCGEFNESVGEDKSLTDSDSAENEQTKLTLENTITFYHVKNVDILS